MKKGHIWAVAFIIPIMIGLLAPTHSPTKGCVLADSAPVQNQRIVLNPGNPYFTVDGKQSLLYARNVVGFEEGDYAAVFAMTSEAGGRAVRIQPIEGLGWKAGIGSQGELDEVWAARWDRIFDMADSEGLYVIPVFGSWFAWNSYNGYLWKSNPLNKANGGPCGSPDELFKRGSETQTLWLNWLKKLVVRWRGRKNVLAWEIFSELNLVSGATERNAVDFVGQASAIIRGFDHDRRPVTASLSDISEWPQLLRSIGVDFIQIHPYPNDGRLDTGIIADVRAKMRKYGKPVMIGESGLSAALPDGVPETLTTAKNAMTGIRHAMWAAMVSGAMNGRMLYWEDSYGLCFTNCGWPFVNQYTDLERPVVNFLKGVDFSGFKPLDVRLTTKIKGAVLGNDKLIVGWFRDASCEPPVWSMRSALTDQIVTLSLPPDAAHQWRVDFYRTRNGTGFIGSVTVKSSEVNKVQVTLPEFTDDVAFKMFACDSPVIRMSGCVKDR